MVTRYHASPAGLQKSPRRQFGKIYDQRKIGNTSPLEHVGFSTGQLLRYKLITRKPDLADDPTRPAQTLTLSFPTDAVILTGRFLDEICHLIARNELAAVCALSPRYAELNPLKSFVASIESKPITKAG